MFHGTVRFRGRTLSANAQTALGYSRLFRRGAINCESVDRMAVTEMMRQVKEMLPLRGLYYQVHPWTAGDAVFVKCRGRTRPAKPSPVEDLPSG